MPYFRIEGEDYEKLKQTDIFALEYPSQQTLYLQEEIKDIMRCHDEMSQLTYLSKRDVIRDTLDEIMPLEPLKEVEDFLKDKLEENYSKYKKHEVEF